MSKNAKMLKSLFRTIFGQKGSCTVQKILGKLGDVLRSILVRVVIYVPFTTVQLNFLSQVGNFPRLLAVVDEARRWRGGRDRGRRT